MKKAIGPLMGIVVFIVIVIGGYFLGKYIAYEYNKKHNTNKSIFEILKIENTDVPINYVLADGPKTLDELCKKDTGVCNQDIGKITLDKVDLNFNIYANFDNPDNLVTTYFKIGDKKIGSFVYLENFEIFNSKYLLVTEPNSYNNNYVIHLYNNKGKELMSYDATNIVSNYKITNGELTFYYCNGTDTNEVEGEILPRVSYFKVSSDNILEKKEVSYEYKKCA